MKYVFKRMTIPQGEFDDNTMSLLIKIDEGLSKVPTSEEFENVQKQLNTLYVKAEDAGMAFNYGKHAVSKQERDLTVKWIKTFLQKKDTTPIDLELKAFTDYIDTGTDGAGGGNLVPTLLANEINHFVEQGGIARREMRYLPFAGAGNSRVLPTESAGVNVQWLDEGESKPISNITVGKVTQTLKKVAAISVLTEELAEDSGVDLIAYLAQRIGEAILTAEDDQFFAGTGAPWTGLINDPLIPVYPLAPGVGPLDMRPEALLALINSVPSGAMAGAKFYMNRQVWGAICSRRTDAIAEGDGKGVYLVQTPSQGSPGNIWGYPVVLVEALPSLTDLGYGEDDTTPDPDLPCILFGNLQKCTAYGDKAGIKVKLLDQATLIDDQEQSISLAQSDLLAIRVVKRVGYVATLPSGLAILATGPTS